MSGQKYAPPAPKARIRTHLPHSPRRSLLRPHTVKQLGLAIGIHALPKAGMLKHRQFALLRQSWEQTALQRIFVTADKFKDSGLENEEATIYPSFVDLRLFPEKRHSAILDGELAIAGRWSHGCDGRQLAAVSVEGQQLSDIYIGEAIPICRHESRAAHVLCDSFNSPPSHGLVAGIR